MKTTSVTTTAVVAMAQFLTISGAEASRQLQHPHPAIERRQASLTAKGCFSSAGGSASSSASGEGVFTYQSSSHCGNYCFSMGLPVAAITGGNDCYCAALLPSSSDEVDASECNAPCTGYDQAYCGGTGVYNVWLTGTNNDVGSVGGSSGADPSGGDDTPTSGQASPLAASTPVASAAVTTALRHTTVAVSQQPTTIVRGQETIVKTVPASNPSGSASQSSSHSTGSTVGIAVGVVVGVLVLAAIVIAFVFCLRQRRRLKNAENGHARADSLNAFVAGGSKHASAPTANDTRLDPRVMVERRRQSGGSVFADNEDYSRRILKVTNPEEN